MAHATSPDGVSWTRHGELISLTSVIGRPAGNRWGWLTRAEPGVIFLNNAFYLYYSEAKCHLPDCSGAVPSVRGIALAVSYDGDYFVEVGAEPVLLQSASYPITEGWDGYSTPWPVLTSRGLDLFVDVFRYDLNQTGRPALQESIAHYRSTDATRFTEVQAHVIRTGTQPWLIREVRAPSVIHDDDTGGYTMWFAGDNAREAADNLNTLTIGIGIATLDGR
jgi:hypothetical protein